MTVTDTVTDGGASCALLPQCCGAAYLKQGKIDEGVEMLEAVSTGDNTLKMATLVALGFAYEDQGAFGKAGSSFEKAASTPAETDNLTPLLLQKAGENYEADGDLSKARRVYQRIKDEYPVSQQGTQIDKYLGRIAQ